MNRSILMLAAAFSAGALFAQEQEEEKAEALAKDEASARPAAAAPSAAFTLLPLCRVVDGEAEVCRPGGEWMAAEEGRFYPLGTSYRTRKSGRMVVAFGGESSAEISGDAEFGTRTQLLGEKSRTVVLVRGKLVLKLADNLPEGAFFLAAPGFTVKNPAGESRYDYVDMGDGDKVTVRCVTGSLAVEGRHFEIPAMRSANEVVIRTSRDHLSTILNGTSGDYPVRLDQGVRMKDEIGDDGKVTQVVEKGVSEWRMSPSTKVVINRAMPAIGERMSVHTMAFDAAGERRSECYFCEGRSELNSGELVAKEKLDGDALAKQAAEATETTEASGDDESSGDEKKSEEKSSEDNNE